MTELALNNIIKITLAVFALVIVIAAIYLSVNTYIIPYFTGITFNQSYGNNPSICEGKTFVGLIEYRAPWLETNQDYFIYKGAKTKIYFLKDTIYENRQWPITDKAVGKIQGSEIVIFPGYSGGYAEIVNLLDGAFVGGKEICK
jgi:hypothetical protein